MKRTAVHQFLPTLAPRDAVGNHTLRTQEDLRAAGVGGAIWAEDIHPELVRRASNWDRYPGSRGPRRARRVICYQASTGSRGMVDFLLERSEPKVLWYHNITPPEFYEAYDPGAALTLTRGREELKALAPSVASAVADSVFNAAELRDLGLEDVTVCPPYLPAGLEATPDRSLASWLRRTKRGIDLLFVGRVAPNKGHVHLLRALAALRAACDPQARLFVVGAWGPEAYMRRLYGLRERLGLEGVVFTGSVAPAQLAAYYASADVYLSCSEHEGFGLPLIEAMRMRVPVVAYDSSAVGETLGGTGILLGTTDPAIVAEVVARVAGDDGLREQLVERQSRRVAEIESMDRRSVLLSAVEAALRG